MESAKYCDIGKRDINEDYALAFELKNKSLYVVADGLGGHCCGEVASETTSLAMRDFYKDVAECTPAVMYDMFENAQNALLEKAENSEYKGMRTTAAVLSVENGCAVWGHVGDSRIYMINDNEIKPVTADHSVAYISYLNGEIKYDEIKDSPDQNRLIRTMGCADKFKPDIINDSVSVKEGDAFLLCTDGFWEFISEKEILAAYKKSATASRWLAKMVRVVEKNGKNSPERDNCTAVTVFI